MEFPCMSKIFPGSIVIAYTDGCWKKAIITQRYGESIHYYADGSSLGPYPDLVKLRWSDTNKESKGHFTHGVVLIECYINNCSFCKSRHIENGWNAIRDIALGKITKYSHNELCKLLKENSMNNFINKAF